MKRFSAREFAFVCSPLLIVGFVGWLVSKRKPPLPVQPLHLVFHLEKPTVLEAFKGSDAVLVVGLEGPNVDKLRVWQINPFLEVQTPRGVERSYLMRGYSGVWTKVWLGNINSTRFPVNTQHAPVGKMKFGADASIAPLAGTGTTSARLPHVGGVWNVDRTRIKEFAFASMARAPLVNLRSVKITQVARGKAICYISGECVFDLQGAGMNKQTPFEESFSGGGFNSQTGTSYGIGWGTSNTPEATPETPTWRVREWNINGTLSKKLTTIGRVTGRVSADNHWPLAFQIEPFDFSKIKVGQKLKFKSWPAPIPAISK